MKAGVFHDSSVILVLLLFLILLPVFLFICLFKIACHHFVDNKRFSFLSSLVAHFIRSSTE